jgi:membrane protease YdiL (CAAX protease family)
MTAAPSHRWSEHLRGHLLLFDSKPPPALSADTVVRLLLGAALLEVVRIAVLRWLRPDIALSVLLPVLLGFALLVVRGFGGIKLSRLGLRPWRDWTTTEKSYFLQVVVIANIVFPVVIGVPLTSRGASPDVASSVWNVFVPYLFFGFYQEFVYRGMVQGQLVRRRGAPAGIFVANLLYTFGPLHWNYFASPASFALPMFAAIFAIGLYFGVAYQRSGNLWIVAVFHAIGNAYIVWGTGGPS